MIIQTTKDLDIKLPKSNVNIIQNALVDFYFKILQDKNETYIIRWEREKI
jgi:hypothetical protein